MSKPYASSQHVTLRSGVTYTRGANHAVLTCEGTGASRWLSGASRQILDQVLCGRPVALSSPSGDSGEKNSEVAETIRLLHSDGFLLLSGEPPAVAAPRPLAPAAAEGNVLLTFLFLELTARCNLLCVHCYGDAGGPATGDLSPQRVQEILRDAREAGCRRIQLTGGEPLLRRDLPQIVASCRELGFDFIEVYTNATLLTPGMVQCFKEHGVHVAVSFYSWRAEIHDSITGRRGSWFRTVQALHLLREAGVPIRVGLVALKQNQDDLEETCDFLYAMGVTEGLHADPVRPTGRGDAGHLVPTHNGDGPDLHKWIRGMLPSGPGCSGCGGESGTCWAGKLAITGEGSVIPCIFARSLVLGSVHHQGLASVIASEQVAKLWGIRLDDVEVCRDCEFRRVCTDCRALPLTATDNLYAKSPRCPYDPYRSGSSCGEAGGTAQATRNEKGIAMVHRPRARTGVLKKELDGQTFLIDPDNGAMYGLNPTAELVWLCCDGSRSFDEIVEMVCAVYETKPKAVRRDVEDIVRSFQSRNLLDERMCP